VTSWTPQIVVKVNGATYSGYVDWNINISCTQNELWSTPYPSSAKLSLHFTDSTSIKAINIGDEIAIQINYSTGTSDFYTGLVSDLTMQYTAYGASGFILTKEISLIGAISIFVNNSATINDYFVYENSSATVGRVLADLSYTTWTEMGLSTAWQDLDPTWTWNNINDKTIALIDDVDITENEVFHFYMLNQNMTMTVLEWLNLILVQSSSIMWEGPTGKVYFLMGAYKPTPKTIPVDVVNPYSLHLTTRYSDIKNRFTITDGNTPANKYIYSDVLSASTYGVREGAATTYLDTIVNNAENDNFGNRIIDRLAYPKPSISGFGIDLLNTNLTDAQRDNLLLTHLFTNYTLSNLDPMWGYSNELMVLGYNWSISKNSFYIETTTYPTAMFYGGDTWLQISPKYTWTSYGTAFPTQKWSDL
jgi:hypothetical protein